MPQILIHPPVRQSDSGDSRNGEVTRQVAALQRRCRQGLCCERLLQSVTDLFASLPLTTEEYGRACCHVANARRYLEAGERGAAEYETRMLAGVLTGDF